MPYRTNEDLPPAITRHFPAHAQDIYREAFNNAWREYGSSARREEIAHRVAWSAVKKLYQKIDGAWVAKADL